MPEGDTLFRTAAGLRPYLVGRDVRAARAQGPGAVPQVQRVVGKRIDAVESQGKNLLIRFDGGLELRTHLRMNGSWHRYRPGERWRRPPGRARLVLEVDGAVAVCFDAPVVELFETRSEAPPPVAVAARAGPARARLRCRRGASPAARRPSAPSSRSAWRSLDQRALAGIGNVYKNEVLWIERVSPFARVATSTTRPWSGSSRPPGGCCSPTSTRGAARSASRPPATAARPGRCTSTAARAGRAGAAARAIAVARQGTDLPRSTYWCPTCQGPGPGA